MTDITERLRAIAPSDGRTIRCEVSTHRANSDIREAADEIERLRAALRLAIELDGYDTESVAAVWLPQALTALGDQP